MADESETPAQYLALATKMRAAADRTFDPAIAAGYLAIAAKWLRLAEEAQRHVDVIDRSRKGPSRTFRS